MSCVSSFFIWNWQIFRVAVENFSLQFSIQWNCASEFVATSEIRKREKITVRQTQTVWQTQTHKRASKHFQCKQRGKFSNARKTRKKYSQFVHFLIKWKCSSEFYAIQKTFWRRRIQFLVERTSTTNNNCAPIVCPPKLNFCIFGNVFFSFNRIRSNAKKKISSFQSISIKSTKKL